MALEDNFLRLDPYNFDTEKDFAKFCTDDNPDSEQTETALTKLNS